MLVYLVRKCHSLDVTLLGEAACPISKVRIYLGGARQSETLYVAGPGYRPESLAVDLSSQDRYAFVSAPQVAPEGLLEACYDALVALERWDGQLKNALLGDVSLPLYMELGEKIFSSPYAFVDKDLVTLAASRHYASHFAGMDRSGAEPASSDGSRALGLRRSQGLAADEYQLPPTRVQEMVENEHFFEVARYDQPFYYDEEQGDWSAYCINLTENGIWTARLVFYLGMCGARMEAGEEQLAQHYFTYLVEVYKRYTGSLETSRSQSDALHTLLRQLLVERREPQRGQMDEALESYGWGNGDEYTLVRFVFFEGANWEVAASYLCRQLEWQWRNSVALASGHAIIWVFNHSLVQIKHRGGEFMQSVVHLMREHACKAGLSDSFSNFSAVRSYHYEAEMALTLGQAKDPHFWYFRFGDYLPEYLLHQATEHLSGEQLVHPGLLALQAHDAQKDTDYLPTLLCYLRHNQNAVRTADELYIHRTSLIRRIGRIKNLSGIDLDDAGEVAYVLFSYRLLGFDLGGGRRGEKYPASSPVPGGTIAQA